MQDTEIAPKILRFSKHTDMTIHWKALEDHFLMVQLVFWFTHFCKTTSVRKVDPYAPAWGNHCCTIGIRAIYWPLKMPPPKNWKWNVHNDLHFGRAHTHRPTLVLCWALRPTWYCTLKSLVCLSIVISCLSYVISRGRPPDTLLIRYMYKLILGPTS
jgi:hypothetical protein